MKKTQGKQSRKRLVTILILCSAKWGSTLAVLQSGNHCEQVVHTRVPLLPTSINFYQSNSSDVPPPVTPHSESNLRFDITLASGHASLTANGLSTYEFKV